MLHLVEQEIVDLDEPVTRYLPDAPADVTLRQALVHSSALLHIRPDGYAAGGTPGISFSYSGAGYLLASDVVEHLTDQSLADYLSAQVLTPLGMTQSGYGDYPADKTRMATPHASTSFPVVFVLVFGVGISLALVLANWNWQMAHRTDQKITFQQVKSLVEDLYRHRVFNGYDIAVLFFKTANAIHYALVVTPIYAALLLSLALLTSKQKAQNKGYLGKRYIRVVLGLALLTFSIVAVWQRYPVPIDYRNASPASFAGLRTTASDMALFLDELMAPKHVDEKLIQNMLQSQIEASPYYDWGLGIGIQTNSKQKNIWHWGVNYPGYQALMVGYPEHRLGIVVLMNGGPMWYGRGGLSTGGLELARIIVAEAVGGEHHDYWKGVP